MKASAGKQQKQQMVDADEANRVDISTKCLEKPKSSLPPLETEGIRKKMRTSRAGGSAKYIRKLKKGKCQYVSRRRSQTKMKGEVCGRIGTIREDGSSWCWYHLNRAKRLDEMRFERLKASLQTPDRLEWLKAMIQLEAEELRKLDQSKHAAN